MEEGIGATEKQEHQEGEAKTALETRREAIPSTEFVKVEKNLASLGFFTPSSKRVRNAQEKSFTITTVVDGQRVDFKGTIIPAAKYGLPITADQDKWIALCKILTDILRREGKVSNPISFTSADILRLLHQHRHSGKNYREIEEWLDVLFSTTIFSEGVVYLAGEKRRAKDRFRVFDRAISFGKELPDGRTADKNYVWFSDWQLQNINNNHLLPIDIEAYRELKNHIAKALVPLLQVWLFATRDEGVFEKRYDELCEILNIQRYRYPSLIRRMLGPSLEELKQFGYLADWQIQKTSDGQNYKVLFYHGEKFHRDRRARLSRKPVANGAEEPSPKTNRPNIKSQRREPDQNRSRREVRETVITPPHRTFDPLLIAEFTRRGIAEEKATELLANLKPGQDVVAQLEYIDQTIKELAATPNPVRKPAGFYVALITRNTGLPDGFETSAKRKEREERERMEEQDRAAREKDQQLQWNYDDYCDGEIDRWIAANPDVFEAIKQARWEEDRQKYSFTTESMAKMAARLEVRKRLSLPTFEEWFARKEQGTRPSPEPHQTPPAAELVSATMAPPDSAANTDQAPVSIVPEEETAAAQLGDISPADPALSAAPEPTIEPANIPVTEPAMPEPLIIDLVSEPPPQSDGNAAGPSLA